MNDLIEKLYDLHLNTSYQPLGVPDKEAKKKEIELYHLLYEDLSEENKRFFMEYVNLTGIRMCNQVKAAYECGFKTAIRLLLESLKD